MDLNEGWFVRLFTTNLSQRGMERLYHRLYMTVAYIA